MGKYKYLFYLAILLSVVSSVISLGAYLNVYYVIESMLSAKGNLNKSVIEDDIFWMAICYLCISRIYVLWFSFTTISYSGI